MKQLAKAGVDLAEPDTILAVVGQLDDLVSQLESTTVDSTSLDS